MSNPCINRWGLNAFWHHYWYSDSNYASFLQQDKIFIELVQLYLKYGTVYSSTFSYSLFWHKTAPKPKLVDLQLYYRWVTTRGREPHEVATSRLRLETAETFQTRASVLRFDSWFILNIYWFQPDKFKNKRDRRSKTHKSVTPLAYTGSTLTPLSKLNSLVTRYYVGQLNTPPTYNF